MTREEVKEFLLSKCKILNTYSWSDDRKAYDVPKYVLSDSKTLKLIDQIYNYNEAQLKAKDEEIERLEGKTQILEVLVDNTKDIIEAQTRMCKTKARSIVAMLFWEWKKAKTHQKAMYLSDAFKQAYKILKEQQ